MSKKKVNKFVLLGWDAAEWKILQPMMDQGMMPTLKKFLEEGVSGKIQTLDPPFSPMLWTSIATGKRAYDHGIMGFIEPTPNGDSLRPVMSTSRKVKAIWNILNQEGLKSNVIGWWPSHPAEPINGVMVSNFYQNFKDPIDKPWPMPEGTVHPKELEAEFKKMRVHADEITFSILLNFVPDLKNLLDKYIPLSKDESLPEEEKKRAELILQRVSGVSKNLANCTSIHSAGTYVLANTEWDFTAIYLDTIDHLSHIAMKFHPPKMKIIEQELFDLFKEVVTAGYRFHDMMLERVLSLIDDDTTVMILSDHGFHPDHQRPKRLPKEPASPALEHSPYGFIAIKGPAIKKGETIFGASLLDITPTLLHLYGLPVGKDMEGNVLNQIFIPEYQEKVEYIDSWETREGNDGRHQLTDQVDTWASREAMQQLIDLGYVEKPDNENMAKAVEEATAEARYYLARTYVNADKIHLAIPIFEELHSKYPEVIRFNMRLANAYLQGRQFKKCRQLIAHIKALKDYPVFKLQYMEGMLELNTFHIDKAVNLFKDLDQKSENTPNLLYQIGKAYNLRYRFKEAQEVFEKVIALDHTSNLAFHGLGLSYLRRNEYEKAAEAFLSSIEINNNVAQVHFHLGEALYKLDLFEQAEEALKMALFLNPKNIRSHYWLSLVYDKLNNKEAAKSCREIFDAGLKGERIIVTGLQRSGTSLMMQILKQLKIDILYDDIHAPDEFNPDGYFEYQPALNIITNKEWIKDIGNKAVKVYANRLTELPTRYRYKIIWMDREMNDIMGSYLRAKGKKTQNFDSRLADNMTAEVNKAQVWMEALPYCETLIVNYRDLINNPENEIANIAGFLDLDNISQDDLTKVKSIIRLKQTV